ncbi:unnamed protein product, partial [Discosporangium mesarthrocarpum]
MRKSRLNDRLRDAQEGNRAQHYAYGDTHSTMLMGTLPMQSSGLSQSQSQENDDMSICDLRAENAFRGRVCNLWGFLDYKRNLKVMQNPVGELYLVGEFLTNIHTC